MTRLASSRPLTALALTLFCGASMLSAFADDPTPAPAPAEHGGHHRNPAFAGCKKQADDQKMARGDARKEFIKNCMKTAPAAS